MPVHRLTRGAAIPTAGRRREWVTGLALLVLSAATYGRTLGFGFVTFDDPSYVTDNPHVKAGLSWAGVWWAARTFETGNWHPLTWISLMGDATLYGLRAGGYHLTNLLLHTLAGLTLYAWLRVLAADAGRSRAWFWSSVGVSALFLVHPTHAESVSWVTERKDVLSGWLFFLALLAYTGFARLGTGRGRRRRWGWYGLSLALCTMGLAAKSILVTFPAILLLLDVFPLGRWERGGTDRPNLVAAFRRNAGLLVEKLPFAVLAAGTSLLTMSANQHHPLLSPEAATPWQRLLNSVLSDAVYVARTVWPFRLCAFYPSPRLSWPAGLIVAAILLVGMITWAVIRLRRRHPLLLAGWLWYLCLLFPVSGVVPVGNQFVPDRFAYLAHVGLFVTLGGMVGLLVRPLVRRLGWSYRRFVPVVVCVTVVGCAGLACVQAGTWTDSETLYRRGLAVGGPRERVELLLGEYYARSGRPESAEPFFTDALRRAPGDKVTLIKAGFFRLQESRWAEARDLLLRAFRLDPEDPVLVNNLGFALEKTGSGEAAFWAYQRGLRLRPDFELAHLNLAEWFLRRKRVVAARGEYESALVSHPDWPPALNGLGRLYARGSAAEGWAPNGPRALGFALRAVNVTGGRDLGSLETLAWAYAADRQWDQATGLMQVLVDAARTRGSADPASGRWRDERLAFQRHELPAE